MAIQRSPCFWRGVTVGCESLDQRAVMARAHLGERAGCERNFGLHLGQVAGVAPRVQHLGAAKACANISATIRRT